MNLSTQITTFVKLDPQMPVSADSMIENILGTKDAPKPKSPPAPPKKVREIMRLKPPYEKEMRGRIYDEIDIVCRVEVLPHLGKLLRKIC